MIGSNKIETFSRNVSEFKGFQKEKEITGLELQMAIENELSEGDMQKFGFFFRNYSFENFQLSQFLQHSSSAFSTTFCT